jgi:hypothetical protein
MDEAGGEDVRERKVTKRASTIGTKLEELIQGQAFGMQQI